MAAENGFKQVENRLVSSGQVLLAVECEIICSVKSVFQAVQLLLYVCYVFISYPKLLGGLFVFFKCYVLFIYVVFHNTEMVGIKIAVKVNNSYHDGVIRII